MDKCFCIFPSKCNDLLSPPYKGILCVDMLGLAQILQRSENEISKAESMPSDFDWEKPAKRIIHKIKMYVMNE
jgi:hypothetical protein